MNPSEWELVCDDVRRRWGPSRAWAQADQLWKDVTNIDRATAQNVVLEFFAEGRSRPPSLSEFIKIARANAGQVVTMPGPEDCTHPAFGIVEEDATHRLGVCRVCGTEVRLGKHRLLTEGEVEDRRLASQKATPPIPAATQQPAIDVY